jgi:hypothetical protein
MDGAAGLWVAVSLAASPVVYEQARRFIGIFFTGAFFFSLVTLLDRPGVASSYNGSLFLSFSLFFPLFLSLGTHICMALKIKQIATFNESHLFRQITSPTFPAMSQVL